MAARISERTDALLSACDKLETDLNAAPQAVEARMAYFMRSFWRT